MDRRFDLSGIMLPDGFRVLECPSMTGRTVPVLVSPAERRWLWELCRPRQ
jgi:hypothetical protein